MAIRSVTRRQYQETHPWITFTFNITKLSELNWMRIGETISKCDHIAGVPLKPATAWELHQLYVAKGVHATTQIEGNTLTEDEVRRSLEGKLELPPSQEYLQTEALNMARAYEMVFQDLSNGQDLMLTPDRIKHFNRIVLADLEMKDDTVPGEIRQHSVLVGGVYRGAPAEDCEYLLERLCGWLATITDGVPRYLVQPMMIARAILAHLYLAWIHPFGDGNGRTARIVESQLLLAAGFPTPASLLLSNHYNRTRQTYYRVLQETSGLATYPVDQFVSYALDGLVEGLREQLQRILVQQLEVAWVNFVHEVCRSQVRDSVTRARQRMIALTLPVGQTTPTASIRHLTPQLAEMYAGLQDRAVSRDINALRKLGLIRGDKRTGVQPAVQRLAGFMPLRQT